MKRATPQPDLFAPPPKPARKRKAARDRAISRRELRSAMALYAPPEPAGRIALGLEADAPASAAGAA